MENKRRKRITQHAPSDNPHEAVAFGDFGTYMRNKRKKLGIQNNELKEAYLREKDQHVPQIFTGLSVYINGYTKTIGLQDLIQLLIVHGGVYVPYLDKKSLVTHIVATNLTPSKQKEFRTYKVATPEWLIQSAAQGTLLNWRDFSLFDTLSTEISSHLGRPAQATLLQTLGKQSSMTISKPFIIPPGVAHPKPNHSSTHSEHGAPTGQESYGRDGQPSIVEQGDIAKQKPGLSLPKISYDSKPRQPHVETAPSHAANRDDLLHDKEWMSKNTSAADGFLENFFKQSRLHHLSAWKEEFKQLVSSIEPVDRRRKRTQKLTGGPQDKRILFHIDFDCFFVSAGLVSRPHLKGKPVAVCHSSKTDSSTSEISSCSYEAREKGIKNGMLLGKAKRLCPGLVTIPFEFDTYRRISEQFYQIVARYSDFMQAVSVDEVFIDVSSSIKYDVDSDSAISLAHRIRHEIYEAVHCTASIGISYNMLLARVATQKAKPDKAFHIKTKMVPEILDPMPVTSLPGIGWALAEKLAQENITTIHDLRTTGINVLQDILGRTNGQKFYNFSCGIDSRDLEKRAIEARQSVSVEINYGIRFENMAQVHKFMREVAKEVSRRLEKEGLVARNLTLKIMKRHPDAPEETPKFLGHGVCEVVNATEPLQSYTSDAEIVGEVAFKLLQTMHIPPHELRGIGIQMTKIILKPEKVDRNEVYYPAMFTRKSQQGGTSRVIVISDSSDSDSDTLLVSDKELHLLGIDPVVFRDLPQVIQQETLNDMKRYRLQPRAETLFLTQKRRAPSVFEPKITDAYRVTKPKLVQAAKAELIDLTLSSSPESSSQERHKLLKGFSIRETDALCSLVEEWVQYGDDVDQDDVDDFSAFLSNAVRENLESVRNILKWWKMVVDSTGNARWAAVYESVFNHVNRQVRELYRSNLMTC